MRDGGGQGKPSRLRCAIYTRKSTEEGLDQEFNSLDAQREACAAYVLSQRHEGWTAVSEIYDDGGYSGGNMERPALRALLADVAAGKVDIIVVYKVDRLTRSLADFAKIVEVLDARGASFVSVTQSFNTTTSMGRLTLNVLLSFAQFEREVTGERIRDKIAASKAKGMWMGGPVPLGYDLGDRKLVPNEAEALKVRRIFERYLELRSGRVLAAELEGEGVRSKQRSDRHGRAYGGQPMSRGAIYAILQNRLYVGEVVHRDQVYPGQHDGIIDRAIFDQAQELMKVGRVERRLQTNAQEPSLLAGLVYDGFGRRMSPSHSSRQGRRYRYYTSQTDGEMSTAQPAWRLSAFDLEARVVARLATVIDEETSALLADGKLTARDHERLSDNAAGAVDTIRSSAGSKLRGLVLDHVRRIDVSEIELSLTIDLSAVDAALHEAVAIETSIPISGVRSGKQLKLVVPPAPTANDSRRDPALIKLVVQALSLRNRLGEHAAATFDDLARQLGYGREHAADLLRVSYLAPDILTAIIDGRQPTNLSRAKLIKTPRMPLGWQDQRELLGLA